jgi:hypothetical protein
MAAKAGTKQNPWKLKTPPGTSESEARFWITSGYADDPGLVVRGANWPELPFSKNGLFAPTRPESLFVRPFTYKEE